MSDAIFGRTPSQQQLHQHHMQQALHQHTQQQHMAQSQPHPDGGGEGATPPMPQIRVSAGLRSSKASATPLPQMRNPPEPYIHEFQPKTPDRAEAGPSASNGEDAPFRDPSSQFHQPGHMPPDAMHFHHTPQGPFPQGPYTPRGHQYLDPNMQHIIQDPAMLQHQQMQQQMMQQQQMFNPLPPIMTPTHGMGMPSGAAAPGRGGAGGAAAVSAFGAGRGRGRVPGAAYFQDPMHSIMEEEKERKREMKLLKNREAAREGREKKRRYQMLLEARVSILETQNRALIEELKALKFLFCKPSSVMHQQHAQQHHQPEQHHVQQQQMHYETQQVVL